MGIQKKVWNHLKDFDGVFIIIKTNYNKIIATLLPTKLESTTGMTYK